MSDPGKLRYISTDFDSCRNLINDRLKQRWPGTWTDFSTSGLGAVLVDIMAWTVATVAFMANAVVGESFVSSMRLRESAIRIGNAHGYRLRGPVSATVRGYASLPKTYAVDVQIPSGTSVSAGQPRLSWAVAQDYTIPTGSLFPESSVLTPASGAITTLYLTKDSSVVEVGDGVDARDYVEAGNEIKIGSSYYRVTAVRYSSASGNWTRLILDETYSGASATVSEFEIVDRQIKLVQGVLMSETNYAPAVPAKGYSFRLGSVDVAEGSVSVTVDSTLWTEYQSQEEIDGNGYCLRLLSSGDYAIVFGSGVHGDVVPASATIVVTYRTCAGASANMAAGAISASIPVSVGSEVVSLTFENGVNASQGGADKESLESARSKLASVTASGRRAVSADDYAAMALTYPGGVVAYARAEPRAANTLVEGALVRLYVWGNGAGLSRAQRDAVANYVQGYAVATDYVLVINGQTRPIPVSMRVRPSPGYSASAAASAVMSSLSAYAGTLIPGQVIPGSDLTNVVSGLAEVQAYTMVTPVSDLVSDASHELFAAPDDSTITGLNVMDEASNDLNETLLYYQVPVCPLQAWSVNLVSGSDYAVSLPLVPHTKPNYARVVATSTNKLSAATPSILDLKTGALTLVYGTGVVAPDLGYSIKTVDAYTGAAQIDVWISYTGTDNAEKRREIRAVLRDWVSGYGTGATIFTKADSSAPSSTSNITDLVSSISGVLTLTHVSIQSPTSTVIRYDADDEQIVAFGKIYIQNALS